MTTEATAANSTAAKRIVIAAIGSLGDLHPCLGLGVELSRRGHAVSVATNEHYRGRVEAAGLRFCPLRPGWDPTNPELIWRCADLKTGPEVLIRDLILPELKGTYEDLLAAATGADLMIAGELVFAAPLVAEKLGLRWVSVILSPCSYFSSRDPSVLVNVPWLIKLRKGGWPLYRAGLKLCKLATRHWWAPVEHLRKEEGLSPHCDPLFRDKFSKDLVLAMFSGYLAKPQKDWPAQTVQTGFVSYDRGKEGGNSAKELKSFLAAGSAPIVFTLGSTAVHVPGDFYEASAEAVRRLKRRAVMVGTVPGDGFRSAEILTVPYLHYDQVFPMAAAIVHQGGSGTTGAGLRSGRPTLTVPFGWDQPDNGARVERLGTGLMVARSAYTGKTAAAALDRLLRNPRFVRKAAEVGKQMQKEDGLRAACQAIEAIL